MLVVEGLDAGYGEAQILFGIDRRRWASARHGLGRTAIDPQHGPQAQ